VTGPTLTVWLTGLPGAGKSTAARGLSAELGTLGVAAQLLDGDTLREGLNRDLGFSKEDRSESTRRSGEIAMLLAANGIVPVVSLVSPYALDREAVRRRHAERGLAFFEVWLSTPLEVCEARDPKGLYARARRGEVTMMTGLDDPYEPPAGADLVLQTHRSVEETVARLTGSVLSALRALGH